MIKVSLKIRVENELDADTELFVGTIIGLASKTVFLIGVVCFFMRHLVESIAVFNISPSVGKCISQKLN